MLFARKLDTNTKGESIFHEVKTYFMEKNIHLSNITACATDAAASMVGHYRGYYSLFEISSPFSILHSLCRPPTTLGVKKVFGPPKHFD